MTDSAQPDGLLGFTHVQPSGNRVLDGTGPFPAESVDVSIDGLPTWVVAVPAAADDASLWAVVTTEGEAVGVRVADGEAERVSVTPSRVPGERPPLASRSEDGVELVASPPQATVHSSPVTFGDRTVAVTDDGGVVVHGDSGVKRAEVGALPDARLTRVAEGRYAVLGGRTTRYDHGALGDDIEASTLAVVDVTGDPSVETVFSLDAPTVVEGTAPIVADVDGDGEDEFVVTLADGERGGRVAVYTQNGEQMATGPAFSQGYRWRHQLCVAPFGPDGEVELLAVKTPHIGGVAQFHRLTGESLKVEAAVRDVSTHDLGSRNLDGAVAGDLDDDGAFEVLAPNQEGTKLRLLRRTVGGATVDREFGLDGERAANLTGVTLGNGRAAVGTATTDGTLHVWQS